jgi:hypothetical protein
LPWKINFSLDFAIRLRLCCWKLLYRFSSPPHLGKIKL